MRKEGLFGSITSKNTNNKEQTKRADDVLEIASSTSSQGKSKTPRKTPGKKLFKKLFCVIGSAQKQAYQESSLFTTSTSLEGTISDFAAGSKSSSPGGGQASDSVAPSIATAVTSTSVGSPLTIPGVTSVPSNSTIASEQSFSPTTSAKPRNLLYAMKAQEDPTSLPLPDSPMRETQRKVLPDILQASPDQDMFFSPQSSSSYSENSSPNNHHNSIMTPPSHEHNDMHRSMKTPGVSIPTPQASRTSPATSRAIMFPHPLRTVTEMESPQLQSHISLSQSVSEQQEEDDDEDAFLPDDFQQAKRTYTWAEVQTYAEEAEENLRNHLEDRHQHEMEEFEEEVETQLQEHGTQWKRDADAEYGRLGVLLKEEKTKTQQKHLELLHKVTAMSDLQATIDQQTKEKQQNESRISELEAQLEQQAAKLDNELAKEMYQDQLNQQIQELQGQLVAMRKEANQDLEKDLAQAQAGKEAAEELVAQLEEEIRVLREQSEKKESEPSPISDSTDELRQLQASKDEANQQVLELQAQLEGLRQQVDSSNMEEVILVKSENAAAERKMNDLQEQLDSKTQGNLAAQSNLRQLQEEITSLRQELGHLQKASLDTSAISEVSHEEFFAVQAEVETLRVLRAEEEKERQEQVSNFKEERQSLQKRLDKVEHKYQAELHSPRKKGIERKVEIHALTMEVLPSPQKGNPDNDDASMRNYENLKGERDALEAKLQHHETQAKLVDETVKQVTQELEGRIEMLQMKLKEQQKEHETRQKSSSSVLSSEEIDELTIAVESLKQKHQAELESQCKSAATELEKALHTEQEFLEQLRAEFLQEKAQLHEAHEKEMLALQARLDELLDKHEEEIEVVKAKSKEEAEVEITTLHHAMKRLRIEFEGEKIEIIQTKDELQEKLQEQEKKLHEEVETVRRREREQAENELKLVQAQLSTTSSKFEKEKLALSQAHDNKCDALRVRLVDMKEQLEQAACTAQANSAMELDRLQNELKQVRDEAELRAVTTVTEQYIKEMQAKFEEDMDDVKAKSKQDIDDLQAKLEAVSKEKMELASKVTELQSKLAGMEKKHMAEIEAAQAEAKQAMEMELQALEETIKAMESGDSELTKKVAELQGKTEKDRAEFNRRVKLVRAEHTKEIEELLSQLDEVEAEQQNKLRETERMVKEKDTVISAMGSQLADAERRLITINENKESMNKELNDLRTELDNAHAETESTKQQIIRLVHDHKHAIDEEKLLREAVVEEAREEMIQRAEVQFEQANETYKNLKHEFDTAMSKIKALERDLRAAKTETEAAKKRQEAREVEMADELAQAKAAIATGDLQAVRKAKQYRNDSETSKEAEKKLREKLDEALSTSRSVQTTLAAVVSEKEKLIDENKDMKAVCEELMAMVEGNEQG